MVLVWLCFSISACSRELRFLKVVFGEDVNVKARIWGKDCSPVS